MNGDIPAGQTRRAERNAESIAVLVVNWNGWRHTLACLAALRKVQSPPWHLFIVDNASSDDSLEQLADLGNDVTLIRSAVNGGWTGGNNLGIRRALDRGFDFLFILNNDAEVVADTLEILLREFQDRADEMPILGPVHTTAEGDRYDFLGSTIDDYSGMPRLLPVDGVTAVDLKPFYETAYIRGAGLFVHRRHFEAVGLFDDAFYLNYDETDWSFRARRAGFRSYMVRDAEIRHIGSASIGGASSPLNLYFLTRNRLLFSERHGALRQRYRVWRDLYRRARSLSGGRGRIGWLPRFLTSRAKLTVAFRMGVRDYILRRFGDCPPLIRQLNGRA